MTRCPLLSLMSAMPQKLLRHWVEGASGTVPFAVFSPNLRCPQQLSTLLVKVEKICKRLRGWLGLVKPTS